MMRINILYKKSIVTFIFIFIINELSAQDKIVTKVDVIKDSIIMSEWVLENRELANKLKTLVLDKNLNSDKREPYIYLIEIKLDSLNDYSIEVNLLPSIILNDTINLVFFKLENSTFVIRGENPEVFFLPTNNEEKLFYYRFLIQSKMGLIPFTPTEEFSSWNFSYSNGQFKLESTLWVPED